ncbi:hypothetical protein FRC16_010746 [Serendipita sp. 398]|nr:hypothetical protein FRC16_010746 [Serendipita sp. 398]
MSSQDKLNSITQDDVVIAVMGATGVGKSSFICMATGSDPAAIGHGLRGHTDMVHLVRFSRNNKKYVFLDTPGFNDTTMTDADVLTNIVATLTTTYKGGIKLAGVIYLHRISDNRITMTDRRNTEMFTLICGPNALQNVILTTTMWDHAGKAGEPRETELRTIYWKSMVELGSQMVRFMHNHDSAWDIIDQISGIPQPLLIQSEIVDQGKKLSQTAAGNALFRWFTQLIVDLRGVIRKLKESLGSSKKNSEAYNVIEERLGEMSRNLKRAGDQKVKLEPPHRSFAEVTKGFFSSSTPPSQFLHSTPSPPPQDTQHQLYVRQRRVTAPATLPSSFLNQSSTIIPLLPPPKPLPPHLRIPAAPAWQNSGKVRFSIISSIEPPDLTKRVAKDPFGPVAAGGFSNIYKGDFEHRQASVAIKVIRAFDPSRAEKTERRLAREMNVWWSLKHPNIVPLLGYVYDMSDLPSPVSPWYKNGDASKYIRSSICEQVETRLQLLREVAAGLRYLHHQNPPIVHADLKPANILIDDDGRARLCDFGLARLAKEGGAAITGTVLCTARYAPPELSRPRRKYEKVVQTTGSDMYSLACVAYEFLYLKKPYADEPDERATVILSYTKTPPATRLEEDWHPIPGSLIDTYWEMFNACWNTDEAERLDIDEFSEIVNFAFSTTEFPAQEEGKWYGPSKETTVVPDVPSHASDA